MQYMMMIKADANTEAGAPPNMELIAAIGKLSEEMAKAGVLLSTGGLKPSSQGARVRVSGGTLSVIDGPFAEAKELIAGYAVLEAKSKEEAIAMGRQMMELHQDILGPSYQGECEIRAMFGPEDFGAAEGGR